MTGRYLVKLPADSKPAYYPYGKHPDRNPDYDGAWSRYVNLCRSLNRDGLAYQVRIDTHGDLLMAEIRAHGKPKPKPTTNHRRAPDPEPLSMERCQRELVKARQAFAAICQLKLECGRFIPKPETPERAQEWNRKRLLQREIGHWLGRWKRRTGFIKLTPKDYTELDVIFGRRVERMSEIGTLRERLPERYKTGCEQMAYVRYLADCAKSYAFHLYGGSGPTMRQVIESKMDVDYWAEMVRLWQERQRKPQKEEAA